MTRIVALVPMRHSSERVSGKNYRLLGGKPLFHHIVESLELSRSVDSIAVDTDSPVIIEDLRVNFPDVTIIERPEHLLGGETPMNEILLHDTTVVEADLFLQTHSTNPLLKPHTITAAVDRFLECREEHDSLFSVTPLHTRLWSPDGVPLNHDPNVLLRTQDLPPVLEENSCLYLFDRDSLHTRRNRIGERPLLFSIEPAEAWDIDEEIDWMIVESLFERSIG